MSFKNTNYIVNEEGQIAPIQIEYEILSGLPNFNIIGMTTKQQVGIKDRLRFAVKNCGFKYPIHRQVVNITGINPEDISIKHLDLSLAIGMLTRSHQIKPKSQKYLLLGELSLDGTLKKSNIEPILNFVNQTSEQFDLIIIPSSNYSKNEFENLPLYPAANLNEAITILQKVPTATSHKVTKLRSHQAAFSFPTFEHIRGLGYLKRAIAIAVAGHHKMLIIGFPGLGKTMIARAASNFITAQQKAYCELPPTLTKTQILPTKSGLPNLFQKNDRGLVVLNEFHELTKNNLESMRHIMDLPNNTALIATMTPCRCGYAGHDVKPCSCTTLQKNSYLNKVPLPMLERFDLIVDVKEEPHMLGEGEVENYETTETYFKKIKKVHDFLVKNNRPKTTNEILQFCNPKATAMFKHMYQKYSLSPRRSIKLLEIALTIAMLDGKPKITVDELIESLAYQSFTIHSLNKQLNAAATR